jgi:hypothetical protein
MTPSKEDLERLYSNPNHNLYTIAYKYGKSKVTITKLMRLYGIPMRKPGTYWR